MASSRLLRIAPAVAVLAVALAGCSNAAVKVSAGGGAPGVSSTEVHVGSIANVTGPLSSDFAPVVNGVQAYFSMINAEGGVAGRKLKLAYQGRMTRGARQSTSPWPRSSCRTMCSPW